LTNSKLFSDKYGNLLKAGDIVKFEKLADTLEIIANQGADALYTGQIAEYLIRDLQNEGIVESQGFSAFRTISNLGWTF